MDRGKQRDGGSEHDAEPDGELQAELVDAGFEQLETSIDQSDGTVHPSVQIALGDQFDHDEIPRCFCMRFGMILGDAPSRNRLA